MHFILLELMPIAYSNHLAPDVIPIYRLIDKYLSTLVTKQAMKSDNTSWIEYFWIGNGHICPTSLNNDSNVTNSSCYQRPIFAVGLISDMASMFGAFLIILSFYLMKDLKTTARYFLLFISLADFFNALFYLTAHIWSLFDPGYSVCYRDKSIAQEYYCVAQSTFNVFFSLTSYFWTTILSIHIVLLITCHNQFLGRKYTFRTLVLIGTLSPLVISLVGLLTNRLGPGFDTVSAGWCFVGYHENINDEKNRHIISELLTGKLWDMIALVSISVLNIIALSYMLFHRIRSKSWKSTEQDIKLLLIPVAYLVLRFWGYIRWILEFNKSSPGLCSFPGLLFLQAIGDPGQGWVNAILYLVMTKSVREWVYKECRCVGKRRARMVAFTGASSYDTGKYGSRPLESVVSNN